MKYTGYKNIFSTHKCVLITTSLVLYYFNNNSLVIQSESYTMNQAEGSNKYIP